MPEGQDWDVRIDGRVEYVTDQENFPDLFRAALGRQPGIPIVQFNRPSWPHTTSVVIRVSANSKESAEKLAREMLLDVFLEAAKEIAGQAPLGWTLSAEAQPTSELTS
jgi:hypothetical protein